jgi:hypothetical protein
VSNTGSKFCKLRGCLEKHWIVLISYKRGSEKDRLHLSESPISAHFVRSVFESRAGDEAGMDQRWCHVVRCMVWNMHGH